MTLPHSSLPVLHANAAGLGAVPKSSSASAEAAYAAQLIGQPGVKRGIRGGEAVLKTARAAYLGAEYSGDNDRRPPPGLLRRAHL